MENFIFCAVIIATQGTKTDNQHQKKDKERKQINSFHSFTPQSFHKGQKTSKIIVCYLSSQEHRIMNCVKFKTKK